MKATQSMEKVKIRAEAKNRTTTDISKISAAFIVISAGVIGCMATVSLFAGTIVSGGPFGLIQNYISAITG